MFARLCAALLFAATAIQALNAEEWQEQSIYAVITDRFARSNESSEECAYRNYCGGTWKGIEDHLDYIQGMGFTAVWISPIVKQLENRTEYGYVLVAAVYKLFLRTVPEHYYGLKNLLGLGSAP